MLCSTKAIVLRSVRFSESKFIVDMITSLHGRLSFVVSIGKGGGKGNKRSLFEPLTIVEISFDYKPSKELQTLRGIRLFVAFKTISGNIYKCSIALFVSEFLCCATKLEPNNSLLYNYIEWSIMWLDNSGTSYANFHLVFAIGLTRLLGFYPNLDNFCVGSYFNLQSACFEKSVPPHNNYLNAWQSQVMYNIMRAKYNSMHLFKLSKDERNECIDIIMQYYKIHIPSFPQIKSLTILRELF